jgi:hypothetical protein
MAHVLYAATPQGYAVHVIEGGEVVETYAAGNSRHCSQTYCEPGGPHAIPAAQLRDAAEITAREIAAEYGSDCVEYDDDLEAELVENFSSEYA